ncbi:hypothetical protein GCM10011491_14300 [Brucella endophytica]|uniref:Uncharacterized protein n=1 Tax=Brucella endophytica TaxID=1963359 RepID=A0A916WD63_9HYPH|nr:hypothetical protein [Brucella endophytica]GGA87717.1 hypothetical protein GCM10011491_14300 [Brucella endophytica]
MATTIELASSTSDFKGFLSNWSNAGWNSQYGAFWGPSVGLQTDQGVIAQNPGWDYTEWGNGATGGNGVLIEGNFHYGRGNLTGDVDTLTFGSGYGQSSAGLTLPTAALTLGIDQNFNPSQPGLDKFDLAIYGIMNNSLGGLYDFLAETGTEIHDTAGSDILVGFAGSDTFVFTGGEDVVANDGPAGTSGYQDGTDLLDVSAWGVTDFQELTIFPDSGDAWVAYGNHSIQLAGVDASVLDASDFIFADSLALVA